MYPWTTIKYPLASHNQQLISMYRYHQTNRFRYWLVINLWCLLVLEGVTIVLKAQKRFKFQCDGNGTPVY